MFSSNMHLMEGTVPYMHTYQYFLFNYEIDCNLTLLSNLYISKRYGTCQWKLLTARLHGTSMWKNGHAATAQMGAHSRSRYLCQGHSWWKVCKKRKKYSYNYVQCCCVAYTSTFFFVCLFAPDSRCCPRVVHVKKTEQIIFLMIFMTNSVEE